MFNCLLEFIYTCCNCYDTNQYANPEPKSVTAISTGSSVYVVYNNPTPPVQAHGRYEQIGSGYSARI